MRPTRTPGLLKVALIPALAFALVAAGCGDDDDDGGPDDQPTATTASRDGNGDGPDPTEPAETGNGNGGGASDEGGTITIGGETWTVVPDGQCDVFSGPTVYIWGHADENPDTEITIDYEPGADFISARVQGPDGDPHWLADGDDAISMELDGRTLRGEGTFIQLIGSETAEGSFEVSCN